MFGKEVSRRQALAATGCVGAAGIGTTFFLTNSTDETGPMRTNDFNTDTTQFRVMHAVGNTLFWVHHHRLLALDISDPASPSQIGSAPLPSEAGCGLRVRSDGQYAFVGDGHRDRKSVV